MTAAPLQWIRELAERVGAPAARMSDVAAWCGPFRDPTGFGEQLSIDEPALPGALQVSVLGRPPAQRPEVVVAQIASDERPSIDELEAELGRGDLAPPFPVGARLLVFELPELHASVVARLDENEEAEELSVRRDA